MGSTVNEGAFVHVFLVSFPGQGHVNPLLRLGKSLAAKGLFVTFSAPESCGSEMKKSNPKITTTEPIPYGNGMMRFEFFEDDWNDNSKRNGDDLDSYLQHLELTGKRILPKIIKKYEEQGCPISCLINNPFIPWVCDIAESLGIPSAMLWIQSAASFSAYYHYYNSLVPFPTESQLETDVQLPYMPLLKYDEIPSFLHPSTPYGFLRRAILGQYKNLSKLSFILMETFQELEHDVVNYLSKKFPIKTVGPLFKYPKLVTSINDDVQGDFMKVDENCIDWLDTKSPLSVVYISFGSIVTLKKEQGEEIAYGLLNSGVNFLWVIKPPTKVQNIEPFVSPDGFLEKVGDRGKIVQWCSQEQVLAHPSVACFVTHCGWNSTMEALSSGTPVLAFPQWGDQVTDAKYLVDVFKVGLRLCRGEAENRIIPREEVEKCVREVISGPKAAEMKENALKWKKAAEEAVADGGSSERNLQDFVDYVRSGHEQHKGNVSQSINEV